MKLVKETGGRGVAGSCLPAASFCTRARAAGGVDRDPALPNPRSRPPRSLYALNHQYSSDNHIVAPPCRLPSSLPAPASLQ